MLLELKLITLFHGGMHHGKALIRCQDINGKQIHTSIKLVSLLIYVNNQERESATSNPYIFQMPDE
jgi:hypothetical protein